ncbi:MAG TPA: hypothetical protein VGN23_13475 [Verrucomicrobiae bacterium]|jgi:hypothetical protein
MPDKAQITSVEAIELFRAALILYTSQTRPVLDEASSEITRTHLWLQNDQRYYWETQLRTRNKALEQAKQELFTARISQFQETTSLLQMTVRRAQNAVQQAEDKLKLLKRWDRDLDNRAAPLLKEIEQLHGFLTADIPRATATLMQIIKTLDAYTGVTAPKREEKAA